MIDLCYTLIRHFRALYQMYLSLGVDIGQDGSPNHQEIDELRNHTINVSLTIFAHDGPA